jgi:von Willebrand factor type A domain
MSRPAGLPPVGDLGRIGDVGALPRTRRWPWLLLLAAALASALALAAGTLRHGDAPTSLSGAQLDGDRGAGCVRLALVADDSGSMDQYAEARRAAVREVLRWAPGNLRGDDQLTVVEFAGSAATTLPTVDIAGAASARLATPPPLDDGSALTTALDQLAAQEPSPCDTVAVVVSDGLVDETDPSALDEAVTRAGVDRMVLLLPSRDLGVPAPWRAVLPSAQVARTDAGDPRAIALALGRALADYLDLRLLT